MCEETLYKEFTVYVHQGEYLRSSYGVTLDDTTTLNMGLTSPDIKVPFLASLKRSMIRLQKLDFVSGSSKPRGMFVTEHSCIAFAGERCQKNLRSLAPRRLTLLCSAVVFPVPLGPYATGTGQLFIFLIKA